MAKVGQYLIEWPNSAYDHVQINAAIAAQWNTAAVFVDRLASPLVAGVPGFYCILLAFEILREQSAALAFDVCESSAYYKVNLRFTTAERARL